MINVSRTDLPELNEFNRYLKRIWKTHWLTNNGSLLQEFEAKLKEYLGVKYILPVTNGTLAIQIAVRALNLTGEIITTPFTFAASTTALLWEHCKPVFADINSDTYNIDVKDIERKITKKTTAILAVHVYGNPCDVLGIHKIAKKYKLKVIYDAAHAFGVRYNNQSILNYGDMSTLSFHATKTFHTIEGGAIVTNSRLLYEHAKLLINFGIRSEEKVLLPGINAKMNEFQAAMGLCNLRRVDNNIKRRGDIYRSYVLSLKNSDIKFQKIVAERFNYTYMPILLKNKKTRDLLFKNLLKHNIKSRKYFYPLITDFDFLKQDKLNYKLKLSNSVNIADRVLCLPIYSTLKKADLNKIIKIVRSHI